VLRKHSERVGMTELRTAGDVHMGSTDCLTFLVTNLCLRHDLWDFMPVFYCKLAQVLILMLDTILLCKQSLLKQIRDSK
jgi:hypothetical protein